MKAKASGWLLFGILFGIGCPQHQNESAVDAPNLASKRILENVGFKQVGEISGTFGPIHTYEMFL